MNSTISYIAVVMLLASGYAAHASDTVYKSKGADGETVYSDETTKGSGAKEIKIPQGTTYAPPAVPKFEAYKPPKKEKPFEYVNFAITSPKPDSTIWDNTGQINISVTLEPQLRHNHKIEILYDGKVIVSGHSLTASISNADRGSHTITARVVDTKDRIISSVGPVNVFLKRHFKR